MKRSILLSLVGWHIIISFILFFVGRKYAFVSDVMDRWISNLILSLFIALFFIFVTKDSIKKLYKSTVIIYPFYLLGTCILVLTSIPTYSYKEAVALVEEKTGEEPVESINESSDIKSQIGQYFIYINNEVYIFNVDSGDFAKRERLE